MRTACVSDRGGAASGGIVSGGQVGRSTVAGRIETGMRSSSAACCGRKEQSAVRAGHPPAGLDARAGGRAELLKRDVSCRRRGVDGRPLLSVAAKESLGLGGMCHGCAPHGAVHRPCDDSAPG